MKKISTLIAITLCISTGCSAFAQSTDAKLVLQQDRSISDFLVDLDPGPVSAAELLGVSSSAVTSIQSPKDFIAAFTTAGDKTKNGVGLSITPARTSLSNVSIADYRDGSWFWRAWSNTTFSYAQNKKEQAAIEYKQDAVAARVSAYYDSADDPSIITYNAFVNCVALQKLMATEADLIQEKLKGLKPEEIPARIEQIKSEAAAQMKKGDVPKETNFQLAANAAVKSCMKSAKAPRWNSTQFALTVGQGWIKGPQSDASKLSLGRNISIAAAVRAGEQGLLNVTLRRSAKELDLSSIATTPTYKSSSLAAARFTYGHGDARDTYLLAEVSNAKASTDTLANSAFKYALGVDHRVMGAWVEFRLGRGKMADGIKEETKALLTFKLSPTSTLPKAAGG